jgi:hypothetical protein
VSQRGELVPWDTDSAASRAADRPRLLAGGTESSAHCLPRRVIWAVLSHDHYHWTRRRDSSTLALASTRQAVDTASASLAGRFHAFNPRDPRLLYRQRLSSLCLDTRYNVRRLGSARVSRGFSRYSHLWSRRRHLNGLPWRRLSSFVNDQGKGQSQCLCEWHLQEQPRPPSPWQLG